MMNWSRAMLYTWTSFSRIITNSYVL